MYSDEDILQGGYVVFLTDQHNNSCPIYWKSTRLWWVAKSTLATETLVFTEEAGAAYFIIHLGEESESMSSSTQINTHRDSLYDSASTASQTVYKRLSVEMSAIREIKDKG